MNHYTKLDIMRLVEEEDVEFIRLQFTDIYGNLKNMAVTARQLTKVLNNKCMFDGAAIEGFARIEEADLYLHPDLNTFTIFPWRPQQGKVARLICDIYKADGTPFEGDPRYILKKTVQQAKEMGYTFYAGPECEFFLFDMDEMGEPTTRTKEKGGFFDIGPVDLGENVRREMVLALEDMGFEVETSHHEDAPAQHEIDFKYDEAVKTADNLVTFKMAVRTIAKRHGYHATFMPKPNYGMKGSGMHVNMSLFRDGKNIFADKMDPLGLSEEAYYFIAGILSHVEGMSLITNPIVNSYKRLVTGYDAPVYVAWSCTNRTPLLRIPGARGEETRIELRSPDPSSNPYLVLAVCLAAGLDGIRRRLTPPARLERNVNEMSAKEREELGLKSLPSSLEQAIQAFQNDEYIKDVVGASFANKYVEYKKEEWSNYCLQVTPWEVEQYLQRI